MPEPTQNISLIPRAVFGLFLQPDSDFELSDDACTAFCASKSVCLSTGILSIGITAQQALCDRYHAADAARHNDILKGVVEILEEAGIKFMDQGAIRFIGANKAS